MGTFHPDKVRRRRHSFQANFEESTQGRSPWTWMARPNIGWDEFPSSAPLEGRGAALETEEEACFCATLLGPLQKNCTHNESKGSFAYNLPFFRRSNQTWCDFCRISSEGYTLTTPKAKPFNWTYSGRPLVAEPSSAKKSRRVLLRLRPKGKGKEEKLERLALRKGVAA